MEINARFAAVNGINDWTPQHVGFEYRAWGNRASEKSDHETFYFTIRDG